MRELRVCNSNVSSNKKKSSIHSLPEEIIIYVLVLLPADVIYHSVRYVCRKWLNIIRTPMFVAEHLRRYRSAFLSQPPTYEPACIVEFGESNANVTQTLLPWKSVVCASCDGLAVVRVAGKFYVANLLTKQTISLPWVDYPFRRPHRHSISLIRGMKDDDYRVVFSYLDGGDSRNLQCMFIAVGKEDDDGWKPISCEDLAVWYRVLTEVAVQTVGVGGIVYWIVDTNDTRVPIFALGHDMETFHQLPNPRLNYERCHCAYVGGRKSLSLVASHVDELVLDVWFLSHSGGFEWRKEKRIDLRARSLEFSTPCFANRLRGLAWVDDDQVVVLKCAGCFVYHNVKTGKTFKFGSNKIIRRGYFADFTYSLVPLTSS